MRTVAFLACSTLVAVAGMAEARSKSVAFDHFEFQGGNFVAPFTLEDAPVGEGQAPAASPAASFLQGSKIAAIRGGAVVVDADSGKLVRTDGNGEVTAQLDIAPGAAQLVVDAAHDRVFVTDRSGDRIVVADLSDGGLRQVDSFGTRAEPFGVALTPDGKTLLVTTVADHSLTAFDVGTGMPRWNLELGPEPRGVAISPQGHEALVTFLTTGAVARIDIRGDQPRMSFVSIDPGVRANPQFGNPGAAPVDPLSDEGKSFARNAFAAAYVGHGVAVVPHQLSTPHLASGDFEVEASGYGGGNGFTSPVNHRLAFLSTPDAGEAGSVRVAMATTNLHQPRALAYDGRSDTLYVAGYGSDDVLAVANVSQASVHATWQHRVSDSSGACGPEGLAVDPDDGHVLVFCSLTRRVVRLSGDPASPNAPTVVAHGNELAASRLSPQAQAGRALFRKGNAAEISTFGAMACATCHAESRADGLSWRLQGKNLQTPLLSGRIHEEAAPFKWDGKDATVEASLINTVQRLGGTGIDRRQAGELAAFLASVEAPRKPTVEDPAAVVRGKELFESDITGCAACHNGTLYTDQQQYDLDTDLGEVDTPSLVGLAQSAPYYHDGSARTLEAMLKGNASIHGMGNIAKLSDAQIDDLVQYLETL
ncbi:c-type cytochrome [Paraliomyxa miuraensis]|uniref:c-type cytochrome n=1 Tax=Paraliomyxa miuraensis TaxID=376150 RepID=UPI002255A1B4|nr:c-type cytochrome [Paraliomyxa miuraensis]MCX4242615.1 c-type cytochrome [Paraliomyxa miuraensis]